ncbi:hypothetical protein SISSUDRAFT_864056 [Sistotremastrum suecicum HHB10207 ss-3]|uniref:Uncharacterized protein n=1 Tax=Sistotremastrum suecicum HHB10207 ss-3 TaxID=1314776 RepID=A0A166CFI3_9AGAM|nr:hypothetical protein SISSUDRAFT_864056 [Sistotremastrum suecicum HHB10207 ss-3]
MVAEGSWTILVMGSIHWLVVLRIWSLYERSRIMLLILTFVFLIYFIATAAIWAISVNFMKASFTPSSLNICVGTIAPWLWTIWIPSLLLETFLFVLLFIKSIQHYRKKVNTPVLSVLYFDGFLYFLVISSCSLFNLFVWLLAPVSMLRYTIMPHPKFHSTAQSNLSCEILDFSDLQHRRIPVGLGSAERTLPIFPRNRKLRNAPNDTWRDLENHGLIWKHQYDSHGFAHGSGRLRFSAGSDGIAMGKIFRLSHLGN